MTDNEFLDLVHSKLDPKVQEAAARTASRSFRAYLVGQRIRGCCSLQGLWDYTLPNLESGVIEIPRDCPTVDFEKETADHVGNIRGAAWIAEHFAKTHPDVEDAIQQMVVPVAPITFSGEAIQALLRLAEQGR